MIATLIRRFLLLWLGLMLSAAPSSAADLAITVDPMVFEFTAPYGGEQHAFVWITNSGENSERITAKAIDWRTSASGDVLIEQAGHEATRSLTQYLHATPSTFVLAPGESRPINVSLQLPAGQKHAWSVLWGGFLLQANYVGSGTVTSVTPGATVFVYDTASAAPAHLSLRTFSLQRSGPAPRFSANLINDNAAYIRPVARLVLEQHDRIVREEPIPISTIFPGDRRTVRIQVPHVPSGTYSAHLIVQYGEGSILDGSTRVRLP
jgi:hypothetical protein